MTHKILERERARSDRSGDTLAVVAFAPRCGNNGQDPLGLLVRALQTRVRTTDEVGWLDERRVCVVLPDTGMEGARKVAEDVFQSLPEEVPTPECTVFVYPSGPLQGEEHMPREAEQPAAPVAAQPAALEALLLRPMPLWKRAIDLTGALLGLALLAPLILIIAGAVKLSSPGPIIFRQRRSGRGGKPFWMYKFRTMVADAEVRKKALLAQSEQDGPAFKIKNDPRVTRLGRVLRKTSLDELPQLWNVLKGDMSLVGPRPLPCAEADACEGWQRRRLDVTPGITCIWQVRGRSAVSFADWVRMDVQYIRSQSLQQDLKLLLLTVPAVLLRRGAH
jgi:lipopolysaccharide/colanic/teichoic acid biosynthesis glycosyltransferase